MTHRYTPIPEMGLDFVLSGGAIVPLDSLAVIPTTKINNLPHGAVPRANVQTLMRWGQQYWITTRSIMPASWMAGGVGTSGVWHYYISRVSTTGPRRMKGAWGNPWGPRPVTATRLLVRNFQTSGCFSTQE